MSDLLVKIQNKFRMDDQVITLTEREIINNYMKNKYSIIKLMFSSYNTDKVNMLSIALNHELTNDEIRAIEDDFSCELFEKQDYKDLTGYSFKLKHGYIYVVTPKEEATYQI